MVLLAIVGLAVAFAASAEVDFFLVRRDLNFRETPQFRKEAFSLSVIGDHYVTDGPIREHATSYSTLGLNYEVLTTTDDREMIFQAWGQQALDNSREVHITVPEAYVGWTGTAESYHFGVGRRRVDWSLLDREWNLGLWQPLFRWDYLRPQEQGLIGVFARGQMDDWEILGFVSPFFIPDQGPQFTLTDGSFESGNRWFLPPQDQIEVFRNTSAIYYQLDKPRVEDVIFQTSWALRLRKGNPDRGGWMQWSSTHKPMNHLHLGLEGYHSLALTPTAGNTVAIIHASVLSHQVNTVEAGHSWEAVKLWFSASQEKPDAPSMSLEWDQAPLFLTRVYGTHLGHALPLPGLPQSKISWNYLLTDESRIHHEGRGQGLVGDGMKDSIQRFPLQQGIGFRWDAQLWNSVRRHLSWVGQYTYSLPDQASWFSASVKWGFSPQVRWHIGVDVLGVDPGPDGKISEKSSFSRYHQNDRLIGGMTYVF